MPAPISAHVVHTDPEDAKLRLIAAGIGDRFIGMKLSDFGELGKRWLTAFSPEHMKSAKPLLRQGFLAYLNGKGAREFAHTLAAGVLLVFGARVECLHLSDLSDALDNRDEVRIASLLGSDLLVISEFLNTSSCPLAARSAFRVESFLLERTETQGKSVLLVGDGKIAQSQWWTARLITRIQDAFLQETIATYAYPSASQVFAR